MVESVEMTTTLLLTFDVAAPSVFNIVGHQEPELPVSVFDAIPGQESAFTVYETPSN